MEFETIRIDGDGPIRHIVLNRPHIHNAISKQFGKDLTAACRELDEIGDLRVVILRGEGPSFCSGADLKERPFDENSTSIIARSKAGMRMADALSSLNAVTIACIHNHCIGGGAVLPAFCDFRIAAKSTKLTINEISIGVNLSWNAIPPVVQLVGPARAKEMIILGRTYTGEQLQNIGYVNEVVEDVELSRLASGSRSPAANASLVDQGVNQCLCTCTRSFDPASRPSLDGLYGQEPQPQDRTRDILRENTARIRKRVRGRKWLIMLTISL